MAHDARTVSPRTWLTVAVIGLILLVAFAFVREYVRNIDIATELARMEAENAALNTQQLASLTLISQLSTETAVEGEARTKLGLAKEGETMYVVDDGAQEHGEEAGALQETFTLATDPSLSNPLKWFYYFFAPSDSQEGAL